MVSDYPLRVSIFKDRTKTKKPLGWTIIFLEEEGVEEFSSANLFNICASAIIFFQSHHLENNFYRDFFFGAKTINSAVWPLIFSPYKLLVIYIVCTFFIRLLWQLLTLTKGMRQGIGKGSCRLFSIFLNLTSEQPSADCSCKTCFSFSLLRVSSNLT